MRLVQSIATLLEWIQLTGMLAKMTNKVLCSLPAVLHIIRSSPCNASWFMPSLAIWSVEVNFGYFFGASLCSGLCCLVFSYQTGWRSVATWQVAFLRLPPLHVHCMQLQAQLLLGCRSSPAAWVHMCLLRVTGLSCWGRSWAPLRKRPGERRDTWTTPCGAKAPGPSSRPSAPRYVSLLLCSRGMASRPGLALWLAADMWTCVGSYTALDMSAGGANLKSNKDSEPPTSSCCAHI